MEELVEAAKAIASPAEKLIDAISKGIGTLYEPHKIRKIADAEAYKIKVLSEAISQNDYLPITYENGKMQIDAADFEELQNRAAIRFAHQETRRQYNIENIADKAYDMLPVDEEINTEDVSIDWMSRFISFSEDVSDEDIQMIWAKILADEIQHPKTYSLRTLEILKNMSRDDAILFTKICHHIISDEYFPNDRDYMERCGIKYSDILSLDECGLLNSSSLISKDIEVGANFTLIFFNKQYVLIGKTDSEKTVKLSLTAYVLSKTGKELYQAINNEEENPQLFDYAKKIKETNKEIEISLHQIKKLVKHQANVSVEYDNQNILETENK